MASNKFQEALKNYRDLRYLSRNLEHWTAEPRRVRRHPRYASARVRAAPAERSTRASASVDLDAMVSASRRVRVARASRSSVPRTSSRSAAEGPAKEWRKLTADGSRARAAAERRRDPTSSAKSSLPEGLVLEWDLQRDYKARLWGGEEEPRRSRPAAARGATPSSRSAERARRLAREVRGVDRAHRRPEAACCGDADVTAQAALVKQQNFLQAIAVDGAQGAARSVEHVRDPGALLARVDCTTARPRARRPRADACSAEAAR